MKTISIFSFALFLFITIAACNNTKDGTDPATKDQTGMNDMNMNNDTTMMKNMMKDPAMMNSMMTMMMEQCEKDTAMCRTMCTSMMKSPKMKAMMMDMMEKDGRMNMKMDENVR